MMTPACHAAPSLAHLNFPVALERTKRGAQL